MIQLPRFRAPQFFDKDGSPLDAVEWAIRYEDKEYCTIARDEVDGWWINTMWTGSPGTFPFLTFNDTGPYPIFGTGAVLDRGQDDYMVLELWVYATIDAAQQGHRRIVEWMRRPGLVPLLCSTALAEVFEHV